VPIALLGYPRGHKVLAETRAFQRQGLTFSLLLSLEPERLRRRWSPHMKLAWRVTERFSLDAQAACDFSCSGSNRAPFFQRVNVMAAILRASVSRAMEGLIPFVSKRS
jgi:hypothetical protein